MTSVWEGIVGAGPLGPTKQSELSDPKYAHIKELLQAMPMPDSTAAKDAGEKLQDGLTKKLFGQAVGINDEVAIPLNKALETKETRDFVVKMAHDHPEALGKAVDAIVAHPNQAAQITAQAEAQYNQRADQATAKTETSKPQVRTAQPAVGPKPERHDAPTISAQGGTVVADTTHHAPVSTHRYDPDARVKAFQEAVLHKAQITNNPALAAELGRGKDDGLLGNHTRALMKENGIDVSKVKLDSNGIATKESLDQLFKDQAPALAKFGQEAFGVEVASISQHPRVSAQDG